MPSEARSDAARRNGAKSHGPKTPEGKAASSMNALRHGMTAKAVLLTNENPDAYAKLAEAYYEKFQPADEIERDLVDEMLVAKWRQRRGWSHEAALLDLEMDRQTPEIDSEYIQIDDAWRSALAFRALADESKAIQLLSRYETAHRRAYNQALTTLLALRAQPKQLPDTVQPDAEPLSPPRPDPVQPAHGTDLNPSESTSQTPAENTADHSCETNPTELRNPERTTPENEPEPPPQPATAADDSCETNPASVVNSPR